MLHILREVHSSSDQFVRVEGMEDYDCTSPGFATGSNSCGFYGLCVQDIPDQEFTIQTGLSEISIMCDGTGRILRP